MSLVEALGIELSCAPKIATAFGGGIAGYGEVCGAVVGAAMVFGLKYGRMRADDLEAKKATAAAVGRFIEVLRAKYGGVRCFDIIGVDLRTPEGADQAKARNLHHGFCADLAAFAANEALRITQG